MPRASAPSRPAPRPTARPVAPRTPGWVWLGLVLVTAALGAVGYWAFYLPFSLQNLR